jgi:hypothetical protein
VKQLNIFININNSPCIFKFDSYDSKGNCIIGLSDSINFFFVLNEIALVINLRTREKPAVGEIVRKSELPGKNRYGQRNGYLTKIKVKTPEIEFVFESMQVKYLKPLDFIKAPVICVF